LTLSRYRPAAGGRPLVVGRPWANDPWLPGCGYQRSESGRPATTQPRPLVADPRSGPRAGRRPAVARRPRVDTWTGSAYPFFLFFFFLYCPPLFAQVVNSRWLVSAHGRPTQSSPKNFKLP
jgi:hypothetical protein